jgi:hypothetical protein
VPVTPRAPAGLGTAGKALWRRLVDAYEFGPGELAILAVAARQADDVAALEALIADEGLIVTGSQGQPRLSAAITEVRQGRLALGRLLGQLSLPDESDRPLTAASLQAKKAADARWSRKRAERERREAAIYGNGA